MHPRSRQKVGRHIAQLSAYCTLLVLSSYGALWVGDEYSWWRQRIYGFFLMPASILWLYACGFPRRALEWRRGQSVGWRALLVVTALLHLWGVFLLVNALTASPRVVPFMHLHASGVEQRSLAVAYRRGVMGHLFRTRW